MLSRVMNVKYESQKLAINYFQVALVLFGAQILFGLTTAIQYLYPQFLFEIIDFSVGRMVHLNAMIVWLLFAMIGSVYWLLPEETGIETVGIKLGRLLFYILTLAITIVVVVYLLVQVGPGNAMSRWFIHEGREYIEAPRWADIGIVVVMLGFLFNVYATAFKGRRTGIVTVLMLDLLALAGLYMAGMFFTKNISVDQFWWWWVIHLWVEATWEVYLAAVLGYGLIKTLGANRKIIEMWIWIEVAMLFGSGILGIGHHYFWIGTPEYWLEIGALFSALEPVPLLGMFVHVIYDWGKQAGKRTPITNTPAFSWFVVCTFGNFLGAGVWGFMHTLPQINLYTHGTQWTAAHGHLAFYGAFVAGLIGMMYIALQGKYGLKQMRMTASAKLGVTLLTVGMLGMTMALTIAGYVQTFIERGQWGATWEGYFAAQNSPWMIQAYGWRLAMGVVFTLGFVFLVKDMMTIARKAPREDLQTESTATATA